MDRRNLVRFLDLASVDDFGLEKNCVVHSTHFHKMYWNNTPNPSIIILISIFEQLLRTQFCFPLNARTFFEEVRRATQNFDMSMEQPIFWVVIFLIVVVFCFVVLFCFHTNLCNEVEKYVLYLPKCNQNVMRKNLLILQIIIIIGELEILYIDLV